MLYVTFVVKGAACRPLKPYPEPFLRNIQIRDKMRQMDDRSHNHRARTKAVTGVVAGGAPLPQWGSGGNSPGKLFEVTRLALVRFKQ